MTRPTLVITGANGFVGGHVAALARERGLTVWAVGREAEPSDAVASSCDDYFCADLYRRWAVPAGASAIVHLAGLAAVGPSFAQPQRYIDINSGIMTRMCEALLEQSHRPRVVVVSTGAVYAPPHGDEPLTENAKTVPTSPYAVAKLTVESQAAYYAGRGLDTVIARPFNHIGPGQSRGFLVPDLTELLIDLTKDTPLHAGNLSAARDFTDVRDVARAYLDMALAERHQHAIYNVASGRPHTGFDILAAIAEELGVNVPDVQIDPARLRPNDPARITGSAQRLTSEYGWTPVIDWRQSITDYLAHR